MKNRLLATPLILVCCVAFAAAQTADSPKGRWPYQLDQQLKQQRAGKTPVILYHGGPVVVAHKHLYVVYYGSFTTKQHKILDTFLENIGGTGAFNVNSEYYNSKGQHVQNVLAYTPASDSYNDPYSFGKSLSGNFDTKILADAVADGKLPSDTNGIYILTVSPDVSLPASVWCAYHFNSSSIIPGHNVRYEVAPDPPKSILSSCSGNIVNFGDKTSPNGDIGMDEVVDSMIHELSETVTDPDGTAWYTSSGEENGDLCNFVYGKTFLAPNGSHANHKFGGLDYLAQEIWSRSSPVACVLSH
jgi:hypothetical protein